jgi:hypothetical protein
MKLIITFLCVFFSIPLLYTQEIEIEAIPPTVMDQFMLLYPDAKSITWQLSGDHYKAVFKNNKMATMALIASGGLLLQTETQIKISALPEPALAYLVNTYSEKKIEQAIIREDEKGMITFEAIADKSDFTFDSAGQLMGRNEVAIGSGNKDE